MVYMGKSFGDIISGRKSTTDFMKQADEEERIKRAQAMQEQMMPLQLEQAKLGLDKTQLGMEKLRHEMSQPQTPFTGKGLESDMVRAAYQQNISNGMDPVMAEQSAYDQLLGTKVTGTMVTDPVTKNQSIQFMPRRPMFGTGEGDPVAAHSQATAQRQAEIGMNSMQRPELAQPAPQRDGTLYDQADLATGVLSGARELASRTFGQIPGVPIAEKTVSARNTMKMETQQLINSLRVNPRFSEGERASLKKDVEFDPSVFDSPRALQARMRSMDSVLRGRLENEQRTAQDSGIPSDARAAALNNVNIIRNFLNTLGTPQGNAQAQPAGGSDSDLFQFMTPEERALFGQ